MKKFLFFALALVAGAMAFTACNGNNPDDKPTSFLNIKFFVDLNRGTTPTSHYVIFKNDSTFEEGWELYSDAERTTLSKRQFNTGTFQLQPEYMDLYYTASYDERNGQLSPVGDYEPWEVRVYYAFDGDTLALTFNKGTEYEYTDKYWRK